MSRSQKTNLHKNTPLQVLARKGVYFILIFERSIDKICGKIALSARKSDAGVLYVLQGALTQRWAQYCRKDVYT